MSAINMAMNSPMNHPFRRLFVPGVGETDPSSSLPRFRAVKSALMIFSLLQRPSGKHVYLLLWEEHNRQLHPHQDSYQEVW